MSDAVLFPSGSAPYADASSSGTVPSDAGWVSDAGWMSDADWGSELRRMLDCGRGWSDGDGGGRVGGWGWAGGVGRVGGRGGWGGGGDGLDLGVGGLGLDLDEVLVGELCGGGLGVGEVGGRDIVAEFPEQHGDGEDAQRPDKAVPHARRAVVRARRGCGRVVFFRCFGLGHCGGGNEFCGETPAGQFYHFSPFRRLRGEINRLNRQQFSNVRGCVSATDDALLHHRG